MKADNPKLINCGNDFYEQFFDEVCKELEAGRSVKVYVDCIGHTRNNNVQEIYKERLAQKYDGKIKIDCEEGGYSHSYIYQLSK